MGVVSVPRVCGCVQASCALALRFFFFFQAEDGIRDVAVTGVQTCALPISLDGHHVEVLAPGDDLAEQIAELSPARIVVNLLAPGALGALVAARAAGCGARFWGCLANPGADRALMLGMVEAAESPVDPHDVVTTLERYAARGTRVVTVGADVDGLMSLRQALARKGLSVSMAWDAKQAADLLQVVRPEVVRSEEHTSELQSRLHLVCRLLLEK